MLKIIGRIVMILCVAGLISGGLYFFVNSNAGQGSFLTDQRGGFVRQGQSNQVWRTGSTTWILRLLINGEILETENFGVGLRRSEQWQESYKMWRSLL